MGPDPFNLMSANQLKLITRGKTRVFIPKAAKGGSHITFL